MTQETLCFITGLESATGRLDAWRRAFAHHAPDLNFCAWPNIGDPNKVDYVLAWKPPAHALRKFPNLKAIFSLGAGVDGILADPTIPTQIPLIRMVDPSLTAGMVEYVVLHVLRHHRRQRELDAAQRAGQWVDIPYPMAAKRRVTILGKGELGDAAGKALSGLGFPVSYWRRSGEDRASRVFSGLPGLHQLAAETDILVCLLPLTTATQHIVNRDLFDRLPQGASIINAARGDHLVEQDLLTALDSGHLSEATLDVFATEPLPPGHPFWNHPRVTITPHNASVTRPMTAVPIIMEGIIAIRNGKHPAYIVKRAHEY